MNQIITQQMKVYTVYSSLCVMLGQLDSGVD